MNQPKRTSTNSTPRQNQKTNNNRYSNWPGAIRDVLVTSLNKGQFPVALVLIVLALIFGRLPAADLSGFLKDFLDRIENNYLFGWILFIIALFGWYFHNRFVKKTYNAEIDRITQEKNQLQETLVKKINK
jgi:hypothetical protein